MRFNVKFPFSRKRLVPALRVSSRSQPRRRSRREAASTPGPGWAQIEGMRSLSVTPPAYSGRMSLLIGVHMSSVYQPPCVSVV